MNIEDTRIQRARRGIVSILALLFVTVMMSMAVALAAVTDTALVKSSNQRRVAEAELVAEGGLNYVRYVISGTELPPGSQGQSALDELATALSGELDGSPNLQGQVVSYDGTTILIPSIALASGRSFATQIALLSGNIAVSVTGSVPGAADATLSRAVSMQFDPESGSGSTYGISSEGPIDIGQNLRLIGANNPYEASMYSAISGQAITILGGYVDGDVCTYYADAGITVGADVNGTIKRGVPEVPAPEIDTSIFEPFATNIIDEQSDIVGRTIFENIRIMANTNPEFNSSVTVLGVMYVEAPNAVYFKNNVDFIGIIVTEDPGEDVDPATHYIYFKNNMTMRGLDELPDQPSFDELRELAGAAILAPGFTVEFKNNFTSINGTIAAESFLLKNNLEGTIYGSMVILGADGVSFKNNSTLTIDTSRYGGVTPGMGVSGPVTLSPIPDSYTEG